MRQSSAAGGAGLQGKETSLCAAIGGILARGLRSDWVQGLGAAGMQVVVSLLMKLAGGSPSLAADLNVDAFLQQARSYDEAASSSPLSWYLRFGRLYKCKIVENKKKKTKKKNRGKKKNTQKNEEEKRDTNTDIPMFLSHRT